MPDRQVRIDLQATDHASDKIRDVADEAKDLEQLEPEVEVTADVDKAERQLEDLGDEVKELTRRENEIVLQARVDNLRAALREAQGDLEKTQGKAKETRQAVDDIGQAHPRVGGNIAADITGPLGEASGAASDLGGVFDGLGDLTEAAFSRMGNAALGAGVASAMGGIGLAVAGAAAAWSYFSGKAKKAAEDQKRFNENYKDFQEALDQGEIDDAADSFIELHDAALKAGEALGLSTDEVVAYIEGSGDLSSLDRAWAQHTAVIEANTAQEARNRGERDLSAESREAESRAWLELYNQVVQAKGAQDGANESTKTAKTRHEEVAVALGKHASQADSAERHQDDLKAAVDRTKGALDKLKGALSMESAFLNFKNSAGSAMTNVQAGAQLTQEEILGIKEDYIAVAEYLGLNPATVKTNLERIDQGDITGVVTETQWYMNNQPISINTKLQDPSTFEITAWAQRNAAKMRAALASYNIYGTGGGTASRSAEAAGTSVVNVVQHVPRGYRGDLLTDARVAARRSGGLYQRNRR